MWARQGSIVSFGSFGVISRHDEFCYEDMSEAELREAIENVVSSNQFLRLENDVFERYLTRRDPEGLQTIEQTLETVKRLQKIAPQYVSARSIPENMNIRDKDSISIASIHSGSRPVSSTLTERVPKAGAKISYMQRIGIVNTVILELQKELIKLKQTWAKKQIYLRSHLEKNKAGIQDTCNTRNEFEENVVQKGVDSITGKIPAEKFVRFIEEWFKINETIRERISLKATAVKLQLRNTKAQLRHRTELGETLHAVDFEQLNIENQVCIQRIEEKNEDLLKMKKIAGHYSIALTKQKGKMNSMMSIMNEVRAKIVSKKQEIVKLQSEQVAMQIEVEKTEKQLKLMIALLEDFEVPNVIDFVKMRVKLDELHKIHKRLSRRKKIQQITLKSNR